MTAEDCSKIAEEMISMAWFLTGNELASHTVLDSVICEGVAQTPQLSIAQRARLLVVRSYYRMFGGVAASDINESTSDDNPLWVLPPAERSVFVLRVLMGHAEKDVAQHLGTTQMAISNTLSRAVALIASSFSTQSQYA